MLAQPDVSVGQPPLLVELPPELANFFDEGGYVSTTIFEQRSNARLRVRTISSLRILYTMPFSKRTCLRSRALIKDLSKKGIGILLHEQLWPGERFCVELLGRLIIAEVVRCRKLGHRCFEIGSVIDQIDDLPGC